MKNWASYVVFLVAVTVWVIAWLFVVDLLTGCTTHREPDQGDRGNTAEVCVSISEYSALCNREGTTYVCNDKRCIPLLLQLPMPPEQP